MFILPSFHPAHVLRNSRKLDGLCRFDLKRAVRLRSGWRPAKPQSGSALGVDSIPPARQVAAAIRSLIGTHVACDIETDGKHPLVCGIRCLGLWNGKSGVCVTFLYRDGSTIDVPVGKKGRIKKIPAWTHAYSASDEALIIAALNALFDSVRSGPWSGEPDGHDGVTTLYGWNFQFDSLCLRSRLGVRARYTFDGIVAHHVLLPYWKHDLAFATSVYTDFVYYKKTDKGAAWSTKSDYELRFYCVTDCIAAWLTCEQLIPELRERPGGVDEALSNHDHRYVRECEDWRETGVLVDTDVLAILREHYSSVRDRALAKMQEIARMSSADMDAAKSALDALAGEADGTALDELVGADDGDTDASADVDDADADTDADTDEPFAPASLPQLRALLAAIGIPLTHTTGTGVASTAKEFLLEARRELLDLGAGPSDPGIAFLDYLFAWREAGKVVSTFLKPELIDGRLHPTFSVHVVPSGRLSSKAPNYTNQPKEIRCMYVAPDGYKLAAGDWDALEMRLSAYISGDKALIGAFDAYDAGTGPKIHKVNCAAIFDIPLEGMNTDDPKVAPLYRAAKSVFYCLAEGTPVALLNGSKPIERVKPGDLTWCWDGKRYAQTKIKCVAYRGVRDCASVTMIGGGHIKRVVATPDHEFMLRDGTYKRADRLEPDDRLMPFYRYRMKRTGYVEVRPDNHAVLAVRRVGKRRVWDLGVEHPAHNFAIDKAVFVKNCISYGGGVHTAYETARKEMPDLSFSAFSTCYNRLKAKYPRLFEWQKEHVAEVAQRHYLDTAINGRRVWFFEPIMDMDCDEAAAVLNTPMQGGGADVVSNANIRVLDRVIVPMRRQLRRGEAIRQFAQIHDELLFEVPDRLAIPLRDGFKRVAEEQPRKGWRLPVDVRIVKRWAHVDVDLLLLKDGAVPCLLKRALAAAPRSAPKLKGAVRAALRVIKGEEWPAPAWLKGGRRMDSASAHAALVAVAGEDVCAAALRTLGRLIVEVEEEEAGRREH